MFSKKDIARYYDLSETHYRLFWNLNKSKSLHYGYWDSSTKTFNDALLNINKVLARYANISKQDTVLDAGCGVGGSAIWLAKNIGCKVTGISLNEKQVKQASILALKEEVQHLIKFEQNDYTSTGFAANSFDVVWGIESVCYVPDKSEFMREAFRLLKTGGRLIVADFFKKDGLAENQALQIKKWANGWAIDDYATKENFEHQLSETSFSNIRFENANDAIMPSAKRLYRAYFLGIIPALIYRLFNRKATELGKNNVHTAYLQYKTLKKNLWAYGIFSAEKAPQSNK
jgi:cyclopropane fatty-acyl-phospholipid synthase-like methyltransferase